MSLTVAVFWPRLLFTHQDGYSKLQLHEASLLPVMHGVSGSSVVKWGQLSEGHGGFVAGAASCTVLAVFQGFVSE